MRQRNSSEYTKLGLQRRRRCAIQGRFDSGEISWQLPSTMTQAHCGTETQRMAAARHGEVPELRHGEACVNCSATAPASVLWSSKGGSLMHD